MWQDFWKLSDMKTPFDYFEDYLSHKGEDIRKTTIIPLTEKVELHVQHTILKSGTITVSAKMVPVISKEKRLKQELERAVSMENYEKASELMNEITSLKEETK